MRIFEIPLEKSTPQKFQIDIAGATYRMTLKYYDAPDFGWALDISDINDKPLVLGAPIVTGADMLEQLKYLGINGRLWSQTMGDPDAPPTFESLGDTSKLFFVVD